jgi:hypothetical protein
MDWTVRAATAEDAPAIVALVRMLDDEEANLGTALTVEDLLVNGFGASPRFRILLAESGHRTLGYVLFSKATTPSTPRAGCTSTTSKSCPRRAGRASGGR